MPKSSRMKKCQVQSGKESDDDDDDEGGGDGYDDGGGGDDEDEEQSRERKWGKFVRPLLTVSWYDPDKSSHAGAGLPATW